MIVLDVRENQSLLVQRKLTEGGSANEATYAGIDKHPERHGGAHSRDDSTTANITAGNILARPAVFGHGANPCVTYMFHEPKSWQY
jgi:hypothetical protein